MATPGYLSSVYKVLTVLIPCFICSKGGFSTFLLIYSNAFASLNGTPILSHLSLSSWISIYYFAFKNAFFSYCSCANRFLASYSFHKVLALWASFVLAILFNSCSWAFFFSSIALLIRPYLIFSSAALILSSFDNPPAYYFGISPSPVYPTIKSASLRSASSAWADSQSIAISTF